MERDELAGWLRLSLTPTVGNETARKLLAAFGLPQHIFAQSERVLGQLVSAQTARLLLTEPQGFTAQLDKTWQWLNAVDGTLVNPASPVSGSAPPLQRRLFTLGDSNYPASLLNISDPPLLLYAVGDGDLNALHALAIVGSRNATVQGLENARHFAKALYRAGLTVVSGLALGIDGAAHQGALDGLEDGAGGGETGPTNQQPATIAVVGTGLDTVYPKRHHALAHAIARHGMLLSEYPLGTPPLAANFPRRNRIISALSHGTLVVEAALKSGSLITARLAAEQGKEIFAIPGSIHSVHVRGCHELIRQGAKLVETVQDILDELKLPLSFSTSFQPDAGQNNAPGTPPAAAKDALLLALGYDPVSLDALQARTGMDTALLLARLMEMELEGAVARLPGGLFQRVGLA